MTCQSFCCKKNNLAVNFNVIHFYTKNSQLNFTNVIRARVSGRMDIYDVQKLARYVQIQRPDVRIRSNFYDWRKCMSKNNVPVYQHMLGLMTVIAFV